MLSKVVVILSLLYRNTTCADAYSITRFKIYGDLHDVDSMEDQRDSTPGTGPSSYYLQGWCALLRQVQHAWNTTAPDTKGPI